MTPAQIQSRIKEILHHETTMEIYENILDLVTELRDSAYNDCKAIFAHEIRNEIFKKRSPNFEKNLQLVELIGSCYTSIEIEVQKKLTRSKDGEHLSSIYPHTEINN